MVSLTPTLKSHLFMGGFYHLIEKLNATFVFIYRNTKKMGC